MIDPLGYLGALGQSTPSTNGNGEATAVRKGFSNIEKIMIAGVALNAFALWWQISRVK